MSDVPFQSATPISQITEISSDATQCPRCHAPLAASSGENDTGHVEFECGSWADHYSSPWWDEQCYIRCGPEGLKELIFQQAYMWYHVDHLQGEPLYAERLADAVKLYQKALMKAVVEDREMWEAMADGLSDESKARRPQVIKALEEYQRKTGSSDLLD